MGIGSTNPLWELCTKSSRETKPGLKAEEYFVLETFLRIRTKGGRQLFSQRRETTTMLIVKAVEKNIANAEAPNKGHVQVLDTMT